MKQLLLFFCVMLFMVSCSSENEDYEETSFSGKAKRTMIVYMSGENDLSSMVDKDTTEMIAGSQSIPFESYYIAYIDKAGSGETPSIWRFEKGKATLIKQYDTEFLSTDPERMQEVLNWIISQFPADNYALTLWGHANAWVIENDTVKVDENSSLRRAFGRDTGNNSTDRSIGKWINMPTLASVLGHLNARFEYIFCDCCNMANAETAYELRNVTDYLIASPAEIPGLGAPYQTVSQSFFGNYINSICQGIVDDYYQSVNGNLPLTVVKMSEMDQLANSTKVILQTIAPTPDKLLDLDGLMYYDGVRNRTLRALFDMNDFLRQNASASDYSQWKQALDKAVVYKKFASQWTTSYSSPHVDFTDFTATEEKYGGLSMFIPRTFYDNDPYSKDYNSTYDHMQWYWAVGWNNYGW